MNKISRCNLEKEPGNSKIFFSEKISDIKALSVMSFLRQFGDIFRGVLYLVLRKSESLQMRRLNLQRLVSFERSYILT